MRQEINVDDENNDNVNEFSRNRNVSNLNHFQNAIIIKGARQHNLKNINVEIPKNKIVVVTGLSGSGKSTLAFDTIYAEGQRRYVESLSAYARQFLEMMDKPDVDSIDGLSPAISIQQKTTSNNPRSTVGTVTEIYDYLRLLFARIGIPHCPKCDRRISNQSSDSITDSIIQSLTSQQNDTNDDNILIILAPIISSKKGTYEKLFEDLIREGNQRIRLDGEIINLEDYKENNDNEFPKLDKQKKHTIEVVVDRIHLERQNDGNLEISHDARSRIFHSVQDALKLGNGVINTITGKKESLYSQKNACVVCNISLGELEPRSFSFNSPFGACKECNGLGIRIEFDSELIIPDRSKSILDGAIKPWSGHFATFRKSMLKDVGKIYGFNLNTPISDFTPEQINVILYGTNENIHYKYESKYTDSRWEYVGSFEGVIPNLDRLFRETTSDSKRQSLSQFMRERRCDTCAGRRLNEKALAVKINGRSIIDICDLSISECFNFFAKLELSETEKLIAKNVLKEITSRLEFLNDVGLNYLSLNRTTGTLSGGESQRIRLATQIGSNLTGVLYVLDEPTIGLHQRDNSRLISTLKRLRNLGNTLIIVEHDEDVIKSSDWIIDIGPGAGIHGGEVVGQGTFENIIENKNSLTGQYLKGEKYVHFPGDRLDFKEDEKNQNPYKFNKHFRKIPTHWLTVYGARENNLKSIDVKFPVGVMIVVTGVSGSGKSTLVNEILFKGLASHFGSNEKPGSHTKIAGVNLIDKVIGIDQSPIGRTPRSNAATYVNAFTPIRELFSKTLLSKEQGYAPGRFSFNVTGGRCESCEGCGLIKIEMQFLPDVYVTCDECKGRRYNSETLKIKYKNKTISEILEMSVEEALLFFKNIPSIEKKLETLNDVGLGYIKLGQPATTFSGGEAQRIKLATELSKKDTGKTVYILDEPTTGLHFDDVRKLLNVLKRLVNLGNTVVIIEHNLDVITSADWIIDLGPEGGNDGGQVVTCGSPEDIVETMERTSSYTARYLKDKMQKYQEAVLKINYKR
ncbi:MAG: excinuclease ABC subunit UvrA [Nitrososphaeraceae archaeon]|nr:excinuclease ABC subunit UvrA [Nitrososphaeraceae archaeon]